MIQTTTTTQQSPVTIALTECERKKSPFQSALIEHFGPMLCYVPSRRKPRHVNIIVFWIAVKIGVQLSGDMPAGRGVH